MNSTASFGNKVTARIAKVAAINATARGPGEISGPAVALTIELKNGTADKVSLVATVVNAYYGAAKTPATSMSGPPVSPFHGELAAGGTTTAVYVFSIPIADRAKVLVELSYDPTKPVVQFSGSAR